MKEIIKRGQPANSFRLRCGKVITLLPDVAVEVSDEDYSLLMAEYGKFIMPRIWSELNPDGCFIIREKTESEIVEIKEESKKIVKKKTSKKAK